MRISKITWIILGVVVFAVAAGLLYMMYSRQLDEQDQLKSKLSANQVTLARLVKEREDFQVKLTQVQEQLAQKRADLETAKTSLANAKVVWPDRAESIEYDEKLFDLADGWNLVINVVQAGMTGSQVTQGITFKTNTYSVSVIGTGPDSGFETASEYQDYVYKALDDILGYLTSIVNDDFFSTASIDLVSLSIPPMLSSEEVTDQGTDVSQPVGTINVTVFSY